MVLKSLHGALEDTAQKLLTYAGNQKVLLLEGPMGSGKTTLIKQLCGLLGTVDMVNSPTFSLINEYRTAEGGLIYHFDCYRIKRISDVILLDFESYFASGYYCFVEWPSKIEPILPVHHFLIRITVEAATSRKLTCSSY